MSAMSVVIEMAITIVIWDIAKRRSLLAGCRENEGIDIESRGADMICEIATGLVIVAIFATNVISFIMGYRQREMELENAEKNFE